MAGQSSYSWLAGDDEAATISGSDDYDAKKLRLLGYEPQLKRNLSLLSNFSVTFSIISVLTGITTLYGTGLEFGGPATIVYGWPVAGTFTIIVGLAMAEICSAYPTSGGLYFWSARLCRERRWGPFASWMTGCGATGSPPKAKAPASYAMWSSGSHTPWTQIEHALDATAAPVSSSTPVRAFEDEDDEDESSQYEEDSEGDGSEDDDDPMSD